MTKRSETCYEKTLSLIHDMYRNAYCDKDLREENIHSLRYSADEIDVCLEALDDQRVDAKRQDHQESIPHAVR